MNPTTLCIIPKYKPTSPPLPILHKDHRKRNHHRMRKIHQNFGGSNHFWGNKGEDQGQKQKTIPFEKTRPLPTLLTAGWGFIFQRSSATEEPGIVLQRRISPKLDRTNGRAHERLSDSEQLSVGNMSWPHVPELRKPTTSGQRISEIWRALIASAALGLLRRVGVSVGSLGRVAIYEVLARRLSNRGDIVNSPWGGAPP